MPKIYACKHCGDENTVSDPDDWCQWCRNTDRDEEDEYWEDDEDDYYDDHPDDYDEEDED